MENLQGVSSNFTNLVLTWSFFCPDCLWLVKNDGSAGWVDLSKHVLMFSVSYSTEGNLLTTSFVTLYDQNPITWVSFSTYFDVLDSIFVVLLL